MTDKATHTPLPCPFCGAQIEIAKWEGNYGFAHPRQSERCIMEGDFYDYATEAEALTAWNTRANSHHRLIEAAQAMLPSNLNLADWLDDSAVIPMDVTVGELRRLSAALKEAGR